MLQRDGFVATLFDPLDGVCVEPTIREGDPPRVALVSMPFYSARWASIQLGLLKAVLKHAGFSVRDIYLNVTFAKMIGWLPYDHLSLSATTQVGEWLFASAAYGSNSADDDEVYLRHYDEQLRKSLTSLNALSEDLRYLRYQLIPQFLDACVGRINWASYAVVGFSCTFQQTVASVALAQRIKVICPDVQIVFGGSAVEGEMGIALQAAHPFIDLVVSGEGEEQFIDYLKGHAKSADYRKGQGQNGQIKGVILDQLPYPSYDSFYALCKAYGYDGEDYVSELAIPLELSRGCWWGQKRHCTFCGLNGTTMQFRSKSPERAVEEIDVLSRRYDRYRFQVVDNILDYNYFKNLLPMLQQSACHYEFFFEVKSNLKPTDLALLKNAGCHHIQPGIESLNTHVLSLMQKGVTGIHNVALLKWARYYDLQVSWNLLYGFPGEEEADYQTQIALTPKLLHLQPPHGMGRIRMDRFSPNFSERNSGRFRDVRYARCYDYIYPDHVDRSSIAYFYDSVGQTDVTLETYQQLFAHVIEWKKRWEDGKSPPTLYFRNGWQCLHVVDKRVGEATVYKLVDEHRLIFLATMGMPVPMESVSHLCRCHDVPSDKMQHALHQLVDTGILLFLDNRYFNLALPWAKNWVFNAFTPTPSID